MEIADVELAKMAYLVSALAIVLFTSMILRGLWRPLRFVLIACAISVFFTPYFLAQKMPDGSQENVVPSFVVMLHKIIEDREQWREITITTGKPIAVVAGIGSGLALILALLLPKPSKKMKSPSKKIPEPTQAEQENTNKPKQGHTKKHKKRNKNKHKHKNRYLPDDFVPPAKKQAQP
ncbi:MAG: hypothetical protein IPK30_10595 [Cellvibrionales bacterium]|jgi:hypothetical protein|nr:hypothetical protein [Cellvibrionales bacterium]